MTRSNSVHVKFVPLSSTSIDDPPTRPCQYCSQQIRLKGIGSHEKACRTKQNNATKAKAFTQQLNRAERDTAFRTRQAQTADATKTVEVAPHDSDPQFPLNIYDLQDLDRESQHDAEPQLDAEPPNTLKIDDI
ncbi:hypothetical protein K438DRAFT_1775070 [Mycena galopus ATCC 62051]|nr:hypothetical protein K438DRAFT_1775070 [Mycena galopus ATCC 62051]